MTTVVDTCWGPRAIDDQPYWHLISGSGLSAHLFYNNVRVGKGALLSVSAGIQTEPEIENAQTPYSMSRINDKKESIFEKVRRTDFPTCPPRFKTLYVFDDYRFVERALNEWFRSETKVVHECRILIGSVTHRADTVWLNSLPEQWEEYAQKYWRGEMSSSPFPEVLIHGAIYFPDWEAFPKGYV